MHLETIHIRRYGLFESVELNLGPGLVVVHGPNEAGKTTIASFLRFVLFGPRRRGRAAERDGSAAAGVEVGGALSVRTDEGLVQVERYNRGPARAALPDGRHLEGPDAITAVFGSVDREMYEALWSFSVRDLASLDRLGETALRDRLFSGAIAGAGRTVADAQHQLSTAIDHLWRPRRGGVVRDLAERHRVLVHRVHEARLRARELAALERRRDALDAERDRTITAIHDAERAARRYRSWLAALPAHVSMRRLEEELRALPDVTPIPDELATRAEALVVDRMVALADAHARRADLERATNHRDVHVTPPVVQAFHQLEAEARHWSTKQQHDVRQRASEAAAHRDRALLDAGLPLDEIRALTLGVAEIQLLTARADEVLAWRARLTTLGDLRAEAEEARRTLARVAELRSTPDDDPVAADLADDIERLWSERETALRRRALAQARRDAERQVRSALSERPDGVTGVEFERTEALADPAATVAALGPPWDVVRLANARCDAGSAERIRKTSRTLRDALAAERLAVERVHEEADALRRRGADPDAIAADPAELRAALARLDRAEHARRLAELASEPSFGGGRGAALVAAAALVAVAAWLWARAATVEALAVGSLAVLVGGGGWWRFAPGRTRSDLRARAADAATRAGVAPEASDDDLLRARHRVEEDLATAERRMNYARARERLDTAHQHVTGAQDALADALAAAGWPPGVDTIEEAIGHLRAYAEARALEARARAAAETARTVQFAQQRALAEAHAAEAELLDAEYRDWHDRTMVALQALGCSSVEDLATARARCAAARDAQTRRAPLDREWALANDALERATAAVAGLARDERARIEAEERFRAALLRVGLPPDCAPEAMALRLQNLAHVRRLDDEAQTHERAVHTFQEQAAAFVAQALSLAESLDLGAPYAPEGALDAALDTLRRAAIRIRDATVAERITAEAEAQVRAAAHRVQRVDEALAALFAEVQVADIDHLRLRVESTAARAALAARVQSARALRDAALGPHDPAPLDRPDEGGWARAAEDAEQAVLLAQKDRDRLSAERGALDQEIWTLQSSADIPRLDGERAFVEAELDRARRQLARAVLAEALLERTLARFREAHQPAILARAGKYLAEATDGAYVRIEPADKDLRVYDRSGGFRPSGQLSTGTAELLYLVLRLSLVSEQAPATALPIVLDDVLANLDPERARGVARLLGVVADDHPVLLLTCRPETRDEVRRAVPTSTVLELPRFAGGAGPPGVAKWSLTTEGPSHS